MRDNSEQPVNLDKALLEQAMAILDELENSLNKKRDIWLSIRNDNPNFEQLSEKEWRDTSSRSWLHGGIKIFETNELESWLYQKVELSNLAKSKANKLISAWRKRNNEKGLWGTYYSNDPKFNLKAFSGETLVDFIVRKARYTEEKGKGHRLSWRALKSFLCFLQETQKQTEIAFIEHIFPQKMDLAHGRIIRKVPPEVYPIPFQQAGDLIYTLATLCRTSRRDAQVGIAETLGLCWLCLTASRLRLPTEVEMLIQTKASAINLSAALPTILIPTFFGEQKIIISRRIARFLLALSQIRSKKSRETILQKPLRSLNRVLKKVTTQNPGLVRLGHVTFRTLISPPHIHGENFRSSLKRLQK